MRNFCWWNRCHMKPSYMCKLLKQYLWLEDVNNFPPPTFINRYLFLYLFTYLFYLSSSQYFQTFLYIQKVGQNQYLFKWKYRPTASGKILHYRKYFKRAVNLLLNFASRTRNSWMQAYLQKFANSSRVKTHINMFNLILKHVPRSFLGF